MGITRLLEKGGRLGAGAISWHTLRSAGETTEDKIGTGGDLDCLAYYPGTVGE